MTRYEDAVCKHHLMARHHSEWLTAHQSCQAAARLHEILLLDFFSLSTVLDYGCSYLQLPMQR
jgi:hypothetical protein